MSIDKVYIIHFDELKDRKNYLDNEINNRFGFSNYEFIINTKESDSEILKTHNFKYNRDIWNSPLSNAEICNMHVQFKVWEKIAQGDEETVMIVEDDIIFKDNYDELFPIMIENLPIDYDICFIAECCNLLLPEEKGIYFKESYGSRCCVAYIVNKKSAKKLIEIKDFYRPVDHHLNFLKDKISLKYYWSTPPIFKQGSDSVYKSNAGKNR